ncbi:MAG: hypothetical protein JO069_07055 [Verrucomicrobia bacterium]|nr:hypothetical protein [Verrucomicrobiota bacterium]
MTTESSQVSITGQSAGMRVRARRQSLWPLFCVLAAPSIYFFCRFPPLWRDSDGFFQLGSGINEITLIHWPPLYCLSARVFLLAGALVEGALQGALGHFHWSFGKPTFTNSGLYALLAAQHLALVVSLLVTVATLTGKFWVRLLLALGFALNPSLYAFAHCVGTEAFSNPLTLLTFAASVKVFRRPSPSGYLGYALALGGAVLSRPINAVLAGLLPAALGLAAAVRWARNRRAAGGGRSSTGLFRQTVICAIVGAATIAATGGLIRALCWVKHLPYRSRVGYTFMWRLNYLAGLAPAERAELIRRMDDKLQDPITAAALSAAARALDQKPYWDTDLLYYGISDALYRNGLTGQRTLHLETDQRLNRLARAFLLPPDQALRKAIVHDFIAGFQFTPANVSAEPFRGTDWLQARLELPSFAPIRSLQTFRNTGGGSYEEQGRATAYLQLWAWGPLWAFGLVDLLLGIYLCRRVQGAEPNPGFLVIASVGTGVVLYFLNCCLTFLAARFLLPVEILFWCGLALAAPAESVEGETVLPAISSAK